MCEKGSGGSRKLRKRGLKKFWQERNIAPYPEHMNILGLVEQYHSKDGWLQKLYRKMQKGKGWPPLNPPVKGISKGSWLLVILGSTLLTIIAVHVHNNIVRALIFSVANSACLAFASPISSTVCGLVDSASVADVRKVSMVCTSFVMERRRDVNSASNSCCM